jgi:hypothetical protein
MAFSVWFFLRPRLGELRPVSRTAVQAFLDGAGPLPADEDGYVHLVEVSVRLEQRRAVEVVRLACLRSRVAADSTIDQAHRRDELALWSTVLFSGQPPQQPVEGMIDAEPRFAQRRLGHAHSWQPTEADLAALRTLVNRKARRPIW